MKMAGALYVLSIFLCSKFLTPLYSEATMQTVSWSCSFQSNDVSKTYGQKVSEVLDAMEIDIMTYSTWDVMCQSNGDSNEEVMGSAGCSPSKKVKNVEDCFSCVASARHHLINFCPNSFNASIVLSSCSLSFERLDFTDIEVQDQEEQFINDIQDRQEQFINDDFGEGVPKQRAHS